MKSILVSFIALLSLEAAALAEPVAAGREDFRGRWSRDCGSGQVCHLDVDDTKSSKTVEITFSIEGNGETCTWSVDAIYQRDWGGPVAYDPHGNYYFYLTIQQDGRLHSSGTMMPICGPQPIDQYFISDPVLGVQASDAPTALADADAQALIDNRNVFDHNGSAMIVDPGAGTIVYRDPKKSIARTVKPGTLLFQADAPWDPYDDKAVIRGTAHVFKRGCPPAPYEVSGHQQGWHTLVLKGAAPVREKNGCRVLGYRMNGNSVLQFESWGD